MPTTARRTPVTQTVSRREFLQASAVGLAGFGLGTHPAVFPEPMPVTSSAVEKRCIFLFLCGGPSQIDTFDPKPDAPADVRGPFDTIQTSVPGTTLSGNFPLLARRTDQFAILRSLTHDGSAIHEVGQQLVNGGVTAVNGVNMPSCGSFISSMRGDPSPVPAYVLLPRLLGNTGNPISHGQHGGDLGTAFDPLTPVSQSSSYVQLARIAEESPLAVPPRGAWSTVAFHEASPGLQSRYGNHEFGRNCLLARQLVEAGVQFVTVNMFDTVFGKVSWDCHANGGDLPTTLEDYRTTVCPMFDNACSALLDDLSERGLLESTLVIAVGEFGRSHRLNARGGRGHSTRVWSALCAGGGIRGGQVIGSSDRLGAEVQSRPIHPSDLTASICHRLGHQANLAEPIHELFI